MDIKEEKSRLRKEMLTKLKSQSLRERNNKSSIITDKVCQWDVFINARVIMMYAAMVYEVHTEEIMKEVFRRGKRVVLPFTEKVHREIIPCEIKSYETDTYNGPYGFREPHQTLCGNISCDEIDLILVPGLSFDVHHNRLGRGAGYYDHFLARVSPVVPTAGLAFDFQVLPVIPVEPHDKPLHTVISNVS